MKPEYLEWIEHNVGDNAYGQCDRHTKEMASTFPELRRVCGFYYCTHWGRREHWWLVDPVGNVIDPTASQFPSGGLGVYRELSDEEITAEVPIGTCANCGGDIYRHSECTSTVCSKRCYQEYAAWITSEIG